MQRQEPLLLHVLLPPHAVPLCWLPLSVHTGAPELQSMVAVWQGLLDVQVMPSVHAMQVADGLHTEFTPQLVPVATLVPLSTQLEKPIAQEITPAWQGLDGVQDWFAVQAEHVPPLQTMLVPHELPLSAV